MMVIVSEKLRKYLRLMFKCGNICHTHPYQWNEGLNRGELCTSNKQLGVWYLNLGIAAAYSIYLVGRGLQITLDEGSSPVKKVYIKFIILYYALPALFQTGLFLKKNELAPFYCLNTTAIRIFEDHISQQAVEEGIDSVVEQENEDGPRPPQPRQCLMPKAVDLFLDSVWYGFLAIIPFIGLLNIARPHSAEFISSFLAPSSGIFRWPLIFLSASFHMYYAFNYVANSFIFIFGGFGCGIPALIAILQIKSWFGIHSNRIPRETVERILELYRLVEIIMKAFESSFCDLMVPGAKGIAVTLSVFCAYGAITMEGYLAVFLGAVGILGFGVLVPMISVIAMFDTSSREILQLMKEPRFQNSLSLGQKKEVKSLHPIQLRMRRSYILDKECVKTVYQIIVDSTVDMLLAKA